MMWYGDDNADPNSVDPSLPHPKNKQSRWVNDKYPIPSWLGEPQRSQRNCKFQKLIGYGSPLVTYVLCFSCTYGLLNGFHIVDDQPHDPKKPLRIYLLGRDPPLAICKYTIKPHCVCRAVSVAATTTKLWWTSLLRRRRHILNSVENGRAHFQ